MWILPKSLIQSHSELSAFAQDTEGLNLELSELDKSSSPWLFVNSKPTPLQTFYARWKRAPYLQRLFGRILKPSQWKSFTDAWICLQGASHASHSAVQEVEKEQKIPDTYSHILNDSLKLLSPDVCSWKMSMALLLPPSSVIPGMTRKGHPFCFMSVENWNDWATSWRRAASLRKKWGLPTEGIDGSFMENWPTPDTNNYRDGSTLRKDTNLKEGGSHGVSLHHKVYYLLNGQPHQVTTNAPEKNHVQFPTPRASDAEGGRMLTEQTEQGFRSIRKASGIWFGAKLRGAVEMGKPPQVHLNPNWVEQLMGIPVGWTQINTEWNALSYVEME